MFEKRLAAGAERRAISDRLHCFIQGFGVDRSQSWGLEVCVPEVELQLRETSRWRNCINKNHSQSGFGGPNFFKSAGKIVMQETKTWGEVELMQASSMFRENHFTMLAVPPPHLAPAPTHAYGISCSQSQILTQQGQKATFRSPGRLSMISPRRPLPVFENGAFSRSTNTS